LALIEAGAVSVLLKTGHFTCHENRTFSFANNTPVR
jgi:hypothetical protein